MLKRGWLVGVILGCVACAAGGATGPEATTNPVVAAAIEPPVGNDLARGEWVYARFCATCHGDKGDGRGPTADRYDAPLPRDFTKGKYPAPVYSGYFYRKFKTCFKFGTLNHNA